MQKPKNITEAAEMIVAATDYLEAHRDDALVALRKRHGRLEPGEGRAFAEACGIDYGNVSRVIYGKMHCSIVTLARALEGTRGKFGSGVKE